jgi:hypothetical protein
MRKNKFYKIRDELCKLSKEQFRIKADYRIDKQRMLLNSNLGCLGVREDKEYLNGLLSKVPENDYTKFYRDQLEAELNDTCLVSEIYNILQRCVEFAYEERAEGSQREEVLDFLCGVVDVLEGIYLYVNVSDAKLKSGLWGAWDKTLTRLVFGDYSEYGILVSLGNRFNETRYDVISCSFVTEKHCFMYNLCSDEDFETADHLGWYFRPSPNDVVGMDPTDAGTNYTHALDELSELHAALTNLRSAGDEGWFSDVYTSFQSCYRPKGLCKDGRYNEVLLRGNTKPDGVFYVYRGAFDDSDDDYRKAKRVAKSKGIPVVILNWDTKLLTVELTDYRKYMLDDTTMHKYNLNNRTELVIDKLIPYEGDQGVANYANIPVEYVRERRAELRELNQYDDDWEI